MLANVNKDYITSKMSHIVSDSDVSDRAVGVKPAHISDITSYRTQIWISSVVPPFLEIWVRRKRERVLFSDTLWVPWHTRDTYLCIKYIKKCILHDRRPSMYVSAICNECIYISSLYLSPPVRRSDPGLRMSLSSMLSIWLKVGLSALSLSQQSNMSWCNTTGQSMGAGRR